MATWKCPKCGIVNSGSTCRYCSQFAQAPSPLQEQERVPRESEAPLPVASNSTIAPNEKQWQDAVTEGASSTSTEATGPYSGMAAGSFFLSLLIFLPISIMMLSAIPAIVLGALALLEIRRSNGRLRGTPLAIAGIAISVLIPLLIFFVLVPAVETLREGAMNTQSQNNLKQIALAMMNHDEVYKSLPQQAIYSPSGKPLLSWRVAILGYIEQEYLRRLFKLDEPWDSPHNKGLLHMMPSIYKLPGQQHESSTYYQGFVGKNAIFRSSPAEKVSLGEITDGPANTLLVVEAAEPVPWTKPEDLPYDPDGPLPKLGQGSEGFNAALADGKVIRIDPGRVSERTLRNAITINDGQPLGADWPRGAR